MDYERLTPEQVMAMANRTAQLALGRPLFLHGQMADEWTSRWTDTGLRGKLSRGSVEHTLWWQPETSLGPQVTLIVALGDGRNDQLIVRWRAGNPHVLSHCKDDTSPIWDAYEAFCGARRPTTIVDALLFLAHLMDWDKR